MFYANKKPRKKPDLKKQKRKRNEDKYQYHISASPPKKQSGRSYDAKITILIAVGIIAMLPLCVGPIVYFGINLENLNISDNVFIFIIVGSLFIYLALFISLYIIIGYHLEKRLPRYSAIQRTVHEKKIISDGTRKDTVLYCVLSIALGMDDSYTDFYTPQEIYESVNQGDYVNLVYLQLSPERFVIDSLTTLSRFSQTV